MTKKKVGIMIFQMIVLLLFLTVSVNAWFAIHKRSTNTEWLQVDAPPTVFVRDNSALDDTYVLNYENLVIGEPSYIVFCAVPRNENSVDKYDLQLAFTTNMNATINLYRVSQASSEHSPGAIYYNNYYYSYDELMEYSDGSVALPPEYKDNGQKYQRYEDQIFDNSSSLDIPYWVNIPQNQARFFILEIIWAENAALGVDPKETDIIYVYVKAKESEFGTTAETP